jgi:uncharacterized protein YjbI with pentapeptide repeats
VRSRNEEHMSKLLEGVEAWNQWRRENPGLLPKLYKADLSAMDLAGINLKGADLRKANLSEVSFTHADLARADLRAANLGGANLARVELPKALLSEARLTKANLSNANLYEANLTRADLRGANLTNAHIPEANLTEADAREALLIKADLTEADLRGANLNKADLSQADLHRADLTSADLCGADLTNADLSEVSLIGTTLDQAQLDACRVYGVSVWNVSLEGTYQRGLIVTSREEESVTVDDLKLAQFIYLLLKNEEVRRIIDTITSKVVLILGRFTDERMKVLDTLRQELRARDYTPILFDFEKPAGRDLTETIFTLASMARFVVADISAAKSIPQELSHIIPNLPSVPIQPILHASDREYAMFEHWRRYPWVLPDFLYEDETHLLASLIDAVIEPAERKRSEQTKARVS